VFADLLRLSSELRRVSLCAKFRRGRAALGEEAREDGLNEGAKHDLSTTGLGKRHPEDEDEFEGVVEWEPVNGVDHALKHRQECIYDPVSQPLSIISLASAEQSIEGIVSRNDEASEVDEKFSSNVEEDEEEVETEETEKHVDLGDGRLLLEVVEGRVPAELLINGADVVVGFVLEARHFEWFGLITMTMRKKYELFG